MNKIVFGALFTYLIVFLPVYGFGQSNKDTIYFKNDNRIIGEIKSLDKGVIIVETNYSKNDFNIEWVDVSYIKAGTRFLITLKDGFRFNGIMQSVGDSGKVILKGQRTAGADEETIETNLSNIVYLKGLSSKFWSRAYANIDLGLSLTKANNLRQFSGRTKIGYLADKWQADFYYDALRSKQDSVEATNRQEINLASTIFYPVIGSLGRALTF